MLSTSQHDQGRKKSLWRSVALRAGGVAVLGVVLAASPVAIRQARATTTAFDGLLSVFQSFLPVMNDAWNSVGEVVSAGQEAQAEADARIAQELTDNATKNAEARAVAGAIVENLDPHILQQLLCNMIVMRMLEVAMVPFAEMVSSMIASGIPLEHVGPGRNTEGHYDVINKGALCGELPDGTPATAVSIDGYNVECVAPSEGMGAGELEAAHQSATIMYRDMPMSMPSMAASTNTSGKYTVMVPDKEQGQPSQSRWLAARNYCYNFAGRKPTPPTNARLDSPQGMRAVAQYNHCSAIRSVFIKQCSDRIGTLTRPDCSNPDFDDICKAARDACSAAQKANIQLPPNFDNCKNGLSLYEAQYISRIVCLSGSRAGETALAGASYPMAMRSSDSCNLILDTWHKQQSIEDGNLIKAAKLMTNIDKCWASYERAMAELPKSAMVDPDKPYRLVKATESVQEDVQKTKEIKAVKPRDGEAFYADDLLRPISAKKATAR